MGRQPTSEELLARIVERDKQAAATLYEQFAPSLLGMLLRMLGNRAAAEEVLLEVFERFFSQARRFNRDGASVAAGLVLAARGKAMERVRASRPIATSALDHPERKSLSWLPRPAEVALLERRAELLKKVFGQLPTEQRVALELAVFRGFTETEIARELGEPLGKARSMLVAAMRFLRHRLAAVMRTWAASI